MCHHGMRYAADVNSFHPRFPADPLKYPLTPPGPTVGAPMVSAAQQHGMPCGFTMILTRFHCLRSKRAWYECRVHDTTGDQAMLLSRTVLDLSDVRRPHAVSARGHRPFTPYVSQPLLGDPTTGRTRWPSTWRRKPVSRRCGTWKAVYTPTRATWTPPWGFIRVSSRANVGAGLTAVHFRGRCLAMNHKVGARASGRCFQVASWRLTDILSNKVTSLCWLPASRLLFSLFLGITQEGRGSAGSFRCIGWAQAFTPECWK